jgi:hypothetical protein
MSKDKKQLYMYIFKAKIRHNSVNDECSPFIANDYIKAHTEDEALGKLDAQLASIGFKLLSAEAIIIQPIETLE